MLDATGMTSEEVRDSAIRLWEGGESESAASMLQEYLQANAGDCLAWSDHGVLLYSLGSYLNAEQSFANALRFDGEFPAALRGRSESLLQLRRYADAIDLFERYLKVDPSNLEARLSLVECLCESDRTAEAWKAADSCLSHNPGSPRLQMLLARIYQRQRLPGKLLAAVQTAAALKPDDVELRAQLALAYWEFGKTEDAIRERDLALAASGVPQQLQFNLSWLSLHDPNQTPGKLRRIHELTAGNSCGAGSAPPKPRVPAWGNRQLRVGYISGEFLGGPAFCFLASWLKHFNRSQFHSTFYSTRSGGGVRALAFEKMADCWQDISNVQSRELPKLIGHDEIDILVDLSGQFDENRLEVFYHRPAPVQVTFPNYPSTTGMAQIDYILTDIWTTPNGSEEDYVEAPYRLPSGYLVYEPPCDLPRVSPRPELTNGFITFGLFQRPGKYHARFWDVIGVLFRMLPTARLLIHFASAELDDADSEQRRFLTGVLAARGVSQDRLAFKGSRPELEHLHVVAQADIALDSFPYNGQTTTCDCLWMGVPVVTLRGKTHVSRVGAALLDRVALPQLAAESEEGYIQAAVGLSVDSTALAMLRYRLRHEAQKHLGDGARLAREISDAYRWMYGQRAESAHGTI